MAVVNLPDASKFDADDEISEAQPELKILVDSFRTIAIDYNNGLLGGVDSAGQLVGISQNTIDVINGDGGTFSPDNPLDVFNIVGGQHIETSISADTMTINTNLIDYTAGPGIQIDFPDSAGLGQIGIGDNVDAEFRRLYRVAHKGYKETVHTQTITGDGSTVGDTVSEALDINLGNVQHWTLEANINLLTPANMVSGQSITIVFQQDAIGGHSITFNDTDSAGGSFLFPGGKTGIDLTQAAYSIDVLHIYYTGVYYLCNLVKGYAV
jgi:hypothetical protein